MPRILLATLLGLAGLLLYLGLVLWLGDRVQRLHWTLQLVFYVLAGFVWVFPIRRLMFWAARKD
ncbi:DUF2842 domain-containing protein [Roseomonas sp. KE0001]|uniref:DUF2842 domain-containing protein n=1 Tax=unclassified Roseomonas TaxID=2617492 RepID=UPI0018DF83B2|nr:DUF2842 domain-containing protein [Roseomonas sp. KE0001]